MTSKKFQLLMGVLLTFLLLGCDSHLNNNVPQRKKDGFVCNLSEGLIDEDPPFQEQIKNLSVRYATPTKKVDLQNWPQLIDDLQFDGMIEAINKQIQYYRKSFLFGNIKFGDDIYPARWVEKSLIQFKTLISEYKKCVDEKADVCREKFEGQVRSRFYLYEPQLSKDDPRFEEPEKALFTGYYTPLIHASLKPNEINNHGVYTKPVSSSLQKFSRQEIDFKNALANNQLELYFSKDLFDIYLAQVQGNARVKTDTSDDDKKPLHLQSDEGPEYLTYAGTNGMAWNFISKYMKFKKYISNGSIQMQREFLKKYPEKHEEIFATCPSYVYFNKSGDSPEGSGSVRVTANRTIATDSRYYEFKGMLAFVVSTRPDEEQNTNTKCGHVKFKKFSRFYLDQDTGGAIRGKARADLYFGEGNYAELAAFNQAQRGEIYFLMLKR
jgi:membrane-bound lytic murein transglycosylase A